MVNLCYVQSSLLPPSNPLCSSLPRVQQLRGLHTRQDYGSSIQEMLKKCCYIKCHIGFIRFWRYYCSNLSGTPAELTVAMGYSHQWFYLYWTMKSREHHAYAKFHSKIYIPSQQCPGAYEMGLKCRMCKKRTAELIGLPFWDVHKESFVLLIPL